MRSELTLMKSWPSSVFSFSITEGSSPNKTVSSQANSDEGRSGGTRKAKDRSRHLADNKQEGD
jgi:hypothetical protein